MIFKNGVGNIQAAGYNGARMVDKTGIISENLSPKQSGNFENFMNRNENNIKLRHHLETEYYVWKK